MGELRRYRFEPETTGRKITVTPRDLAVFEWLHRHGALSTPYITSYCERVFGSRVNKTIDRLGALFHEDNTPNGGRYLTRPDDQQATLETNQCVVHDLTDKAKALLKEQGLWHQYAAPHSVGRQWQHDLMLSSFTASMELATLAHKGFSYIHHDEICERIGGPLRFKVDYINGRGVSDTRWLVPDRAFGIKYPGRSVRIFLVEADRGTETFESKDTTRKTLYENDLQYRAFIRSKRFQEAAGITGGVMVLNLMANELRMQNVLNRVEPSNFMLYATMPVFASRFFKTPPLYTSLFESPWKRPGREDFYINKE